MKKNRVIESKIRTGEYYLIQFNHVVVPSDDDFSLIRVIDILLLESGRRKFLVSFLDGCTRKNNYSRFFDPLEIIFYEVTLAEVTQIKTQEKNRLRQMADKLIDNF